MYVFILNDLFFTMRSAPAPIFAKIREKNIEIFLRPLAPTFSAKIRRTSDQFVVALASEIWKICHL